MSSKEYITEKINNVNIISVRKQIASKLGYEPYYGTMDAVESVITDMDHFPYNRFYRGVAKSSEPIVFEREAGWKPIRNTSYKKICSNNESTYPNHCFQSACSTVYPCYPKNHNHIQDCVINYR
jgi:hypothetical protein